MGSGTSAPVDRFKYWNKTQYFSRLNINIKGNKKIWIMNKE